MELDSITGRIAKKLYPQADITVAGFETTDRRDFYDLAVGNVPFGNYKANDKAYNKLGFSIAVLRTHIVNYARTRPVYDAYRKAGYSKRFLEAHREEITLHKAAKAAFDEAGLKKLPKTKDLSIEYAALLKKKKEAYPDYRKARDEMQELMKAQKNVEMFFAEEKDTAEKEPTR